MAIYSEETDPNVETWEQPENKPTKRVVFEIEVNAESNVDAAKIVQDMLQNPNDKWQFYVQDEKTKKIFSVDLDEDESCVELEIDIKNYTPLIEK